MLFFDTETLGLNGPILSVQYAVDQEEPKFIDVWRDPQRFLDFVTLALSHDCVCAWNLTFDWFQLVKWQHFFERAPSFSPLDVWRVERAYMKDRGLVRSMYPKAALDLMLYAQYGPYSHCRRQKDMYIPLVPDPYIDNIMSLFADIPQLKVNHKKDTQRVGLSSISLSWRKGLTTLKAVHAQEFNHPVGESAKDVFPMDGRFGTQYCPFGGRWHEELPFQFNQRQIDYSLRDIRMLQDLYFTKGWNNPSRFVTRDSMLTCGVANTRFHGFDVDLNRIPEPVETDTPTSPRAVADAIKAQLSPMMQGLLLDKDGKLTTKKQMLEHITLEMEGTKAAKLASAVLLERKNKLVRKMYQYLRHAKRFYPDIKVGGTASNRMSGGSSEASAVGKGKGSINPQGVDKKYRDLFTMGSPYAGGDFDGFEVAIAAVVWDSPSLNEALRTGKKIHAMFGEIVLDKPYAWFLEKANKDTYEKCKTVLFARIYGSAETKQAEALNLPIELYEKRVAKWTAKYSIPNRMDNFALLGDDWKWKADKPPISYSRQGFPREARLEYEVAKRLYDFIPRIQELDSHPGLRVARKSKLQTLPEALKSAIYSGIKRIEGRIKRALGNHEIQSTGAEVTKDVQYELLPLVKAMLQVHDELNTLPHRDISADVDRIVSKLRDVVPLLSITWKHGMQSWAEKG